MVAVVMVMVAVVMLVDMVIVAAVVLMVMVVVVMRMVMVFNGLGGDHRTVADGKRGAKAGAQRKRKTL